jgi:hypothetical protein
LRPRADQEANRSLLESKAPGRKRHGNKWAVASEGWQGISFQKKGDLFVETAPHVKNRNGRGRRDRASFGLWDTPQEGQVAGL